MKRQRFNTFCSLLLVASFLVSCSVHTTASTPGTNAATEVPRPIPTEASASPTASSDQCFGSQESLPDRIDGEFVLSGNYALQRPGGVELHESPSYILVPNTGRKIPLPQTENPEIWNFAVSPDKKQIAYLVPDIRDLRNGRLIIIGNDGNLLKEYPENGWFSLVGWISDRRMLISKLAEYYPFTTIVFDPANGTHEELLPNYPNRIIEAHGLPTWDAYAPIETAYSPDLNLVVYPAAGNRIVLWDRKAKKIIAEIVDRSAASSTPLWLSNGREFVIAVSTASSIVPPEFRHELLSVGVDGQVRQLTHLVDLYGDVFIRAPSESVDGRYIAFWFSHVGSGPSRLAIYDTMTKSTKVFCIIPGTYSGPPVWSPNGDQLLVEGFLDKIENYGTIFVDVESGLLAQVEKGVIPVGWMVSP